MANFVLAGGEDGGVADPAVDLARYISVLNGTDPSGVDKKITEPKALDLALANLDKIMAQAGDKSADRETVEGVLNVVCFLFQRVLEKDSSPAAAEKLVDATVSKLTSDSTNSSLRLKTMANIYNILGGNGAARYRVFSAMVTYASAAGKPFRV